MATPVITPSMGLTEPAVGATLAPGWAMLLNANFGILDQHNHTANQGVQIPPAGLNINTDLTMKGNNLIALNSAVFNGAVTGTPNFLSVYSNGTDLFYKDSGGNLIQLTKAGSPNAGTGNIQGLPSSPTAGAGISWVNGQSTFQMLLDAGTVGANVDMGTAILRYPGSYPTPAGNYIALQAPTSLATGFALTLPGTLPSSNQAIILTDTSGGQTYLPLGSADQVLSVNSGGTALQYGNVPGASIAAGTITGTQIATGTVEPGNISNIVLTQPTTTFSAFTVNTGFSSTFSSGTFTSSGTTVTKFLVQGNGSGSFIQGNYGSGTGVECSISLNVNGNTVQIWTFKNRTNGAVTFGPVISWPMSLYFIDSTVRAANTYSYSVVASVSGTGTFSFSGGEVIITEL